MKKILLTVALVAWAGQVTAFSGSELLNEARFAEKMQQGHANREEVFKVGRWFGFVGGVASTLDDIDPKVCLPTRGTAGQYVAVVRQYLEQNPAQLHQPAQLLVREAIRRAFPCG